MEGYARRQLALEPWNEGAHQNLMLALALGGQRAAALRQYEACRSVLAQELGVEPSAETEALKRQIRDGNIAATGSSGLPAQAGRLEPSSVPCAPSPDVFVARDQELARLDRFLDLALAGQGRVAFVTGEAGSGKTMLLGQFARRAEESHLSLVVACGRCSAYAGAGDPFLPFRELLQALCGEIEPGWSGDGGNADLTRRLRALFPRAAEALVQTGADLVGRFVSGEGLAARAETLAPPGAAWHVRLAELARSRPGTPAVPGQEALFEQVTRVLQALARQKPLLLLLDDLQWADAASLSLLFHLGRHLAGCRILLVGAYRPSEVAPSAAPQGGESPPQRQGGGGRTPLQAIVHEFTGQWGDITVDLDGADGRRFVDALLDREPNRLGEAFRERLVRHTEGHALFTVELLRAFQERGELLRDEEGHWVERPALPGQRLPPRVEAVIAERVGRLPRDWRQVLDAAAVEGESFSAEVAARALDVEAGWVRALLSGPLSAEGKLVQPLGVQRLFEGGESLSRYRFAHALFQEYLYGQLDAVKRAGLHEVTGHALEAIYAEDERPAGLTATLAWHYEAAGMSLQAARALHDAGHQAMCLSASRQALDIFDHGLALLADVPPSAERAEIERRLHVARLGPLATLGGSGSSQLAGGLARAADAGAGEKQDRSRLLMLQADANRLSARAPFEDCPVVAARMLEEATQWGDEAFVANAYHWFGLLHHLMGKPQEAESHFEQAIGRLTPELRADLRTALGLDVTTLALTFSAVTRWFLGYPEKALARSTQALAGALEQRDVYGQVFASALGSMVLFLLRGDAATLQAGAELAHRLSLQEGYAWWQLYAEVFLGWLAVMRGEDAGIERMRSAIAGWQAQGMSIGTDGLLVLLADGCLSAARRCPPGDEAERTGLLAIGLATMEPFLGPRAPSGQSFQAELQRVRGELLLARDGLGAAEEAEVCFRRAAQISWEQGALAWELRATTSLVRLRERQGVACAAELAEARQCLAAVYGRFTEGFDTADLLDARALLEQQR